MLYLYFKFYVIFLPIINCLNNSNKFVPRTVKELQYIKIENFHYCQMYLKNNQEIGCSSSSSSMKGRLFIMKNQREEFNYLKDSLDSFVVYFQNNSSESLINQSLNLPNVQGILVSDINSEWSKIETKKPIIFIKDQRSINLINKMYQNCSKLSENNTSLFSTSQMCYLKLDTFMKSAKNSVTCIRRSSNFSLASFFYKFLFFDKNVKDEILCQNMRTSFWTSLIYGKTRENKSTFLVITKLEEIEIMKSNKEKFRSYSNIIFLGLAEYLSHYKQEILANNFDLVFGYILNDDSTSSNSIADLLSKSIMENGLRNLGHKTNYGFSELKPDNILKVLEIDTLNYPHYTKENFISLRNCSDFINKTISGFFLKKFSVDCEVLIEPNENLPENSIFKNRLFYNSAMNMVKNVYLEFILNETIFHVQNLSKNVLNSFKLKEKNTLEVNKTLLRAMIKCFLMSNCQNLNEIYKKSDYEVTSLIHSFNEPIECSKLEPNEKRYVFNFSNNCRLLSLVKTKDLYGHYWAKSSQLMEPRLEIYIQSSTMIQLLPIYVSFFSVLISCVVIYYFKDVIVKK
ncbi:unnamed protein product [Brachionus calyciflorus]|uniref:Nicastrin n=1 Tax=Brachionus calyciflorus TaxID=104777 RepID=A0A813NXG3_9BILA|nr:unnamed protein product [Brachionus calyciflorus]